MKNYIVESFEDFINEKKKPKAITEVERILKKSSKVKVNKDYEIVDNYIIAKDVDSADKVAFVLRGQYDVMIDDDKPMDDGRIKVTIIQSTPSVDESETINESVKSDLTRDFKIVLKPKKVKVFRDNEEYVEFEILMDNGDLIYYDSYASVTPDPYDATKNYDTLVINGEDINITSIESEEGYHIVLQKYMEYLGLK